MIIAKAFFYNFLKEFNNLYDRVKLKSRLLMIVPKSNQKTYGVVHTKNYFSFEGFCKKIDSDEIQEVDVLLDEELIDTITANKENKKVEDIYDLKGFAFTYDLPSEFIGGENQISFKNHKTQENLNNSPCILLNKNDSKFNEIRFEYSLTQIIDENKASEKYTKNVIGFLASEENLENENFVKFIKRLYNEFPQLSFKAFYFNEKQKITLLNIFTKERDRIKIIVPRNINIDIANEIEVFVGLDDKILEGLVKGLLKYNKNIILILYPNNENLVHSKLNELAKIDNDKFKLLQTLGISNNIIEKCDNRFLVTAWDHFFKNNDINYDFSHTLQIGEYFVDILELSFKYPSCKDYLIKLNYLYYKIEEMQ